MITRFSHKFKPGDTIYYPFNGRVRKAVVASVMYKITTWDVNPLRIVYYHDEGNNFITFDDEAFATLAEARLWYKEND
jgi:hypothetical protein